MECKNCGVRNSEKSKFCNNCGAKLVQISTNDSLEYQQDKSRKFNELLLEAETLYHTGRLDEAQEMMVALYKMNNENVQLLYDLGILYKRLKRYKEARSFFEEALNVDPNHGGSRTQLSKLKSNPLMRTVVSIFCCLLAIIVVLVLITGIKDSNFTEWTLIDGIKKLIAIILMVFFGIFGTSAIVVRYNAISFKEIYKILFASIFFSVLGGAMLLSPISGGKVAMTNAESGGPEKVAGQFISALFNNNEEEIRLYSYVEPDKDNKQLKDNIFITVLNMSMKFQKAATGITPQYKYRIDKPVKADESHYRITYHITNNIDNEDFIVSATEVKTNGMWKIDYSSFMLDLVLRYEQLQ